VASTASESGIPGIRGGSGSPRPLYAFLIGLNVVLIALGLILGSEKHAEASSPGTGLYHASGPDPYPALDDYYWHIAFPDSYGPLVHRGVPLYIGDHMVGRVAAATIDDGSVWAYYTVFPRYEWAMRGHNELEPVHGPGGPRIVVYPKGGGEAGARPPKQSGAPLT
jgi:hypothetical protein